MEPRPTSLSPSCLWRRCPTSSLAKFLLWMAAWDSSDASKAELLICGAALAALILNPPKAGAFNKSSGGAHEDTSLRLSIFQVHNQNKTSQPGVARRSS